jgi:transcriptional regulator with XRE-family HTH domain
METLDTEIKTDSKEDCMGTKEDEFIAWLEKEYHKRRWTLREFARQAGISHATISNVINRQRKPGDDFCRAVAKALGEPPESVMRRAGRLPLLPMPEGDPTLKEILEKARYLTEDERQEILDIVLVKYRRRMRRNALDEACT